MMHQNPEWAGEERRVNVDGRVLEQVLRTLEDHVGILGEDHAQHHRFMEELIQREKQRHKFRTAVIEKSVASLVWAVLVGLGLAIWNTLKMGVKS